MANVDIVTIENKKSGSIALDPAVFEGKAPAQALVEAENSFYRAIRQRGD